SLQLCVLHYAFSLTLISSRIGDYTIHIHVALTRGSTTLMFLARTSGEASPENDLGRTFTIKFLHDQSETPRLAARLQAPAPAAHGICCRHRRAPRWGC